VNSCIHSTCDGVTEYILLAAAQALGNKINEESRIKLVLHPMNHLLYIPCSHRMERLGQLDGEQSAHTTYPSRSSLHHISMTLGSVDTEDGKHYRITQVSQHPYPRHPRNTQVTHSIFSIRMHLRKRPPRGCNVAQTYTPEPYAQSIHARAKHPCSPVHTPMTSGVKPRTTQHQSLYLRGINPAFPCI
jgi:hypothetical protein